MIYLLLKVDKYDDYYPSQPINLFASTDPETIKAKKKELEDSDENIRSAQIEYNSFYSSNEERFVYPEARKVNFEPKNKVKIKELAEKYNIDQTLIFPTLSSYMSKHKHKYIIVPVEQI